MLTWTCWTACVRVRGLWAAIGLLLVLLRCAVPLVVFFFTKEPLTSCLLWTCNSTASKRRLWTLSVRCQAFVLQGPL